MDRWASSRGGAVDRSAFRLSPVFVGLVALLLVTGWMLWRGYGSVQFDAFLFVCSGWVVSLCLHEYAHAVSAYAGGDRMVAERGYLSLDPLKYAHPLLSILLPLVIVVIGGIGLPGGAVWVDRHALRSRRWDSFVSFAGPATNLLLAIVLIIPFALGVNVFDHFAFWASLAFLAFLQLTAAILNFLPVPGLDGGNLIEPWLNPRWRRGFNQVAQYGVLLLIALLLAPGVNSVFFGFVFGVANLLGLPDSLYGAGYQIFRFWS